MHCLLCHEDYSDKIQVFLPCSHTLCLNCFIYVTNNKCPVCNIDFKLRLKVHTELDDLSIIENILLDLINESFV